MEKYYLNFILNEVKNFKKLQKQFGYDDLEDLIAHYIEEGVIFSKKELTTILKAIEKQLNILVKREIFNDWFVSKKTICGCRIKMG